MASVALYIDNVNRVDLCDNRAKLLANGCADIVLIAAASSIMKLIHRQSVASILSKGFAKHQLEAGNPHVDSQVHSKKNASLI
jgi:hypothetical protein